MNLLIAFALLFGAPTPVFAASLPQQLEFSTTTAEDIVRAYAVRYGVSGDEMWQTILCEDRTLDTKARGDKGLARGLAQIRSDYHPEVTDAQADDPFFAIEFMAQYFAKGKQSQWSCWNNLFKYITKEKHPRRDAKTSAVPR